MALRGCGGATADAGEWLIGRDARLTEIGDAGLTAPVRLRDAYRVHGGGPEAWAEIEAERAVVNAYLEAETALGRADPVGRVGLLIGPRPGRAAGHGRRRLRRR